jgi:hypothetical protein
MAIREWSGLQLVLTWIWSSLAVGTTEPVAAALGYPLPGGVSGVLRLVLLCVLVTITWKWYRGRTRTPSKQDSPPT